LTQISPKTIRFNFGNHYFPFLHSYIPTNKHTTLKFKNLQKELLQVETKMQSLETQRDELHTQLAGANLSVSDLAKHGKSLKQIEEELPLLEAQWLTLTEQLDNNVPAN
jgi:SMC interacting uncharacterized protein involved in chromosome segregation